jgi:cobalt-zinc-cadmium resistance protein CzcA
VKFSVRGRDLGSLVTEAKQKVAAQIIRPPGYRLEWTGEFKNQQRAMKQRSMIAPLSVLIFAPRFDAFKSVNRALLLTGIS